MSSKKILCEKTLIREAGEYVFKPALITVDRQFIQNVKILSQNEFQEEAKKKHLFLKHHILSPAFVNSHTHLAMNCFRAIDIAGYSKKNMVLDIFFKVEEKLKPEDVKVFTAIGAYECILNGIGFVWDHYFFGEAIAEGLMEAGLSGAIAPTLQDLFGPGVPSLKNQWKATKELASNSSYHENGIYGCLGPHAPDSVGESLWREVIEFSKSENLPIHAHLGQSVEEALTIGNKYKKTSYQFLHDLGISDSPSNLFAHGIFVNESDFKLLKPHQQLIFCPLAASQFLFSANILLWNKYKVTWSVATDCVACNDSNNIQKELKTVAGFSNQKFSYEYQNKNWNKELSALYEERQKDWQTHKDIGNENFLLDLVFYNPGRLHPKVKVGLIEGGYLANMVAWDINHPTLWPGALPRNLVFNDCTQAIDNVCINGSWVGEFGNFQRSILLSDKYQKLQKNARERLQSYI